MPGHWEGDLVIGKDGKTAVATLVERTSRFLILVPLTGRDSLTVGEAIIAATGGLPAQIRRTLTWDCGAEMARHASEVDLHDLPGRRAPHHHVVEHRILRGDGQPGGVVEECDINPPLVDGIGVHQLVGPRRDQRVDPGGKALEDEPILYLAHPEQIRARGIVHPRDH